MRSSLFLLAALVCGLVGAQPGGLPERIVKLETEQNLMVKSRVAFSASLFDVSTVWQREGPHEDDRRLVYRRVVTNVGNGYNPQTGVFTAPVKGLYYFTITGVAGEGGELHAGLKKGTENVMAIYQKAGTQAGASNSMVLALEPNEQISVHLWAGKTIVDQGRLSTFTGFLVFPM